MSIEVMKLALEAIDEMPYADTDKARALATRAFRELREAIEEAEPLPYNGVAETPDQVSEIIETREEAASYCDPGELPEPLYPGTIRQDDAEPMAYTISGSSRLLSFEDATSEAKMCGGTTRVIPLYARPPREWVGLTDKEAAECWTTSAVHTVRNISDKLREKNRG